MWNGTLRFLPTYLLGGYLGCDLFVNLIKGCLELLRRIQSDEVAEVGGVETFLCVGPPNLCTRVPPLFRAIFSSSGR